MKIEGRDASSGCLHELFERQAKRTPGSLAVSGPEGALTYEELDRKADLLAGRLRAAGVGVGSLVGVYLERCARYVVACLGALKAGGAFLALEMAYPPALLSEVVSDSNPQVVVTLERHAENLPGGRNLLCLDEGWEEEKAEEPRPEGAKLPGTPLPGPEDLAFVSYSSGTTGRPKGIANPHRAAVGSYGWRFGVSDYGPGDRVACNVFFIWEVFRPLVKGAASCVVPDDVIYDPKALIGFLREHEITESLFTPSLLEAVLNAGGPDLQKKVPSLKTLWLNGEVVTRSLARRAIEALPETRLLNVYSASETHEIAAGDLRELVENPAATYCPVGRPANPRRLYVLDESGSRAPEGDAGELYVGGDLLARGYVNLPEKTAERFLEDPFSDEPEARMYRTGDKARLFSDGTLEVLGRVDSMVKVRGYSVELGAVEAAVERTLAVRACLVVAEGEEGEDKRLVAYLVPAEESAAEGRLSGWSVDPKTGGSPSIRRALQKSLPHYAIPAVFVEIDSLPLQETTGKVDRNRLPPPPSRVRQKTSSAARTGPVRDTGGPEKEAFLCRVWEEVLGLEEGSVLPEDDFFDLGGHSLAAAELAGRVEEVFGARVSMREFVEKPTVAGLLETVEEKSGFAAGPRTSQSRPALDLRAEAVLDPEIVPQQSGGEASLREARSIFVTGATGFLGAFLLDALLRHTDAEVRVLVRPRGNGANLPDVVGENLRRYGLWRPEYEGRVLPVAGDLGESRFGLSPETFDGLAREVEAVFHAGAAVNLLFPYPALKAANVSGTAEALRLACRYRAKPFHHVSSSAVFPPGWGECREDADLDVLAEGLESGYARSKWVAEKLVRRAEERGLPVRVYRPGNVWGHSESGAFNERDLLGAAVAGCLKLGKVPEMSGWRLEMTPVDFVVGALVRLAGDPATLGGTFHLANPEPPLATTVFGWFEEMGYRLEGVPYDEWAEAWRSAGDVSPKTPPEVHDLRDENVYADENLRLALEGCGFGRPGISAPLMATYARGFARMGRVESPARSPSRAGARRGR